MTGGDLFGRDHLKKLMECGVPINEAQKLAYATSPKRAPDDALPQPYPDGAMQRNCWISAM